jgi:hypothetical protein
MGCADNRNLSANGAWYYTASVPSLTSRPDMTLLS